jgi:hypothetical protein
LIPRRANAPCFISSANIAGSIELKVRRHLPDLDDRSVHAGEGDVQWRDRVVHPKAADALIGENEEHALVVADLVGRDEHQAFFDDRARSAGPRGGVVPR